LNPWPRPGSSRCGVGNPISDNVKAISYTHPVALSEAQDLRARFQPIGLQAGGEARAGLNPELATAQFR